MIDKLGDSRSLNPIAKIHRLANPPLLFGRDNGLLRDRDQHTRRSHSLHRSTLSGLSGSSPGWPGLQVGPAAVDGLGLLWEDCRAQTQGMQLPQGFVRLQSSKNGRYG